MTRRRTWLMPVAAVAALLAAAPSTNAANLIVNGGFEEPVGGGYFTPGSSALTGWSVGGGIGDSVEIVGGVIWPAYDGLQSLDLEGGTGSFGVISQSFATNIGQSYVLSFAYANNYAGPFGSSSADVTVAGSTDLLAESITHAGSTSQDMGWTLFSRTFVADSTTTTLAFASTDGTGYGIALDAVSVHAAAVPEPASLMMGALGFAGGLGLLRRNRVK